MNRQKSFPEYSLVAFPALPHIELVKYWKRILKDKIDWFASCDSKAHVSIMEFQDATKLEHYRRCIRTYCKTVVPTEVTFNKFTFGNGTFFIQPDRFSNDCINKVIRELHIAIDKNGQKPSAHMSIARKLSPDKMQITSEMFKTVTVNFSFLFDALHLRKFSAETGQYSEIVEVFYFSGKTQPTLFDGMS